MRNTPKTPINRWEPITDEVDIVLGPQPNYFEMDKQSTTSTTLRTPDPELRAAWIP